MTERLIAFLLPLSQRERLLLGLGIFVVLPLAILFGLVVPAIEDRNTAQRDYAQTRALQVWVQDRVAEASSLAPATAQPSGPAVGLAAIEQSLIEAKIRQQATSLSARANGGVELAFDQVDFVRLMTWLSSMHPGWGYEIESYRLEATDSAAKVTASLILAAR